MSAQKQVLPKLNPDDSWDVEVVSGQGVKQKIRMREEKLTERLEAIRQVENPKSAILEAEIKVLSIVAKRIKSDNSLEDLTYDEILNQGSNFFGALIGKYHSGLLAIEERNANLLAPSNDATSPAAKSESLIRH